jgi:hypothetical protein
MVRRTDPPSISLAFLFFLPITLPILIIRLSYYALSSTINRKTLENIILENPNNIEDRKAEFAIKLNINADAFENTWQQTAAKYPHLFPSTTAEREILAFTEAIEALLNTPKQIVTKDQVVQLSGLSREKVEQLWPKMHTYGYIISGFIEDEPPRPRRW